MTEPSKPIPHPKYKPVSVDGRNKVSIETYSSRYVARIVAKWAKKEAERKAAMGYDFGYMTPGTIYETDRKFNVVCP